MVVILVEEISEGEHSYYPISNTNAEDTARVLNEFNEFEVTNK